VNIYLVEQIENLGYDTYDSMVVVADSASTARTMHPDEIWPGDNIPGATREAAWKRVHSTWASSPINVTVTHLGVADDPTERIILASFNAG
jgi:hypothetical protein